MVVLLRVLSVLSSVRARSRSIVAQAGLLALANLEGWDLPSIQASKRPQLDETAPIGRLGAH